GFVKFSSSKQSSIPAPAPCSMVPIAPSISNTPEESRCRNGWVTGERSLSEEVGWTRSGSGLDNRVLAHRIRFGFPACRMQRVDQAVDAAYRLPPYVSRRDAAAMSLLFGLCTDQNLTWEETVQRWKYFEQLGFDSVWDCDHYQQPSRPQGPYFE